MKIQGQDLVEYKKILTTALAEFDRLCMQNDITYFAVGGTAIGTVRHKGFIPWDDDIDVAMTRKEFDKFISLKKSLAKNRYKIITFQDDGYYLPSAKFYDSHTTIWEEEDHPFSMGAYIDIFPLDEVDNNDLDLQHTVNCFQKKFVNLRKSKADYRISLLWRYLKEGHIKTVIRRLLDYTYISFVSFFNKTYFIDKAIEQECIQRTKSGDRILNYNTFYPLNKEILPKDWFSSVIRMKFENIEINMPIGYDKYLTQLFGDYMRLPPPEKRMGHHSCYYYNLKEHYSIEEINRKIK